MDTTFWVGLGIGGVIGFVTSYLFYLIPKEEKWDGEFINDKQTLNRFLEKVKFEIDLIIELFKEHENQIQNENTEHELKIDTLYLRRLLLEDPLTYSFGDPNLSNNVVEPIREARDMINKIKGYIEKGEFKKMEWIRISSDLTMLRLKIVSTKAE